MLLLMLLTSPFRVNYPNTNSFFDCTVVAYIKLIFNNHKFRRILNRRIYLFLLIIWIRTYKLNHVIILLFLLFHQILEILLLQLSIEWNIQLLLQLLRWFIRSKITYKTFSTLYRFFDWRLQWIFIQFLESVKIAWIHFNSLILYRQWSVLLAWGRGLLKLQNSWIQKL